MNHRIIEHRRHVDCVSFMRHHWHWQDVMDFFPDDPTDLGEGLSDEIGAIIDTVEPPTHGTCGRPDLLIDNLVEVTRYGRLKSTLVPRPTINALALGIRKEVVVQTRPKTKWGSRERLLQAQQRARRKIKAQPWQTFAGMRRHSQDAAQQIEAQAEVKVKAMIDRALTDQRLSQPQPELEPELEPDYWTVSARYCQKTYYVKRVRHHTRSETHQPAFDFEMVSSPKTGCKFISFLEACTAIALLTPRFITMQGWTATNSKPKPHVPTYEI